MKLNFVIPIIVLSAMLALSTLAQAQSPTGLVNPSFEEPKIAKDSYKLVKKIPGWQTTDSEFEIWGTDFKKVGAYDGDQFAELNARIDGTLYQDSAGIEKGAVIEFSFAHRGRNGDDTMKLHITDLGANNQVGGGDDTVLFTKQYTTGKSDWAVYKSTSEPKIHALGNTVRFAYNAISATGGEGADKTEGNFLDAADFGVGVITAKRNSNANPKNNSSSATNANVLLTLTDDGKDLTFHYTGKMKLAAGHDFDGKASRDRAGRVSDKTYTEFYSVAGDFYRGSTHRGRPGLNTGKFVPVKGIHPGPDNAPSKGVGRGFGISSNELWWDKAYGDLGGTIDVDRKWTVSGLTVDSYLKGSTFLDSGPKVIWTHKTTGSTITMVNGNASGLKNDQRFYIQFPETGAFLSFRNSDQDANKHVLHDVFLAPDGDEDYTKMEFTAVKHDKYFGFRVDNFLPQKGHHRWLEVGDDHKLIVGYRKEDAKPGRGYFLTNTSPFGRYLEAMWVNKAGASGAVVDQPDHHFYLTGSGDRVISKDFKVDQPKDKSAGWKLVPIN